jgi:hypothetical protein
VPTLFHLTSCTSTKSKLQLANSLSTVVTLANKGSSQFPSLHLCPFSSYCVVRQDQSKSEAYRRGIWNYKHLGDITMDPGGFPGLKRPENLVGHPATSSAEVKESVELCLCTLCGPSWPVLLWKLPLPIILRKALKRGWKIGFISFRINARGWILWTM